MKEKNKLQKVEKVLEPNNKVTLKKRKVGHPPKWEKPQQLIDLIQKYLDETPIEEYTVTGLALAVGSSRKVIDDYQKKNGFKDIITEAKLIIENAYELDLRKKGSPGSIFALKNFGWKDKNEQEVYGKDGRDLFPKPIMDVSANNRNKKNKELNEEN